MFNAGSLARPIRAALDTAGRPYLRPIVPEEAYTTAVRNGTRSQTGAPGARYWQQRVRYSIQASLDPATRRINGTERIVYHNRSPNALSQVVFNLYQNLFTEEFTGKNSPLNTGGVTLTKFVYNGTAVGPLTQQQYEANQRENRPSVGYLTTATISRVRLPSPIAPGDSAVFEIDWNFRVPPSMAPRTGFEDALGGRVLQVAQWYPQIAVYDDVVGIDVTPYREQGEFYLEYGDFDVALTLPAGWTVGATGELQNAEEVLPAPVLGRLRRTMTSDAPVEVVTEADLDARRATRPGTGGKVTWRFRARDVRDFAFGTSGRYVWRAGRIRIPGGDGRTRDVAMHVLNRPGAAGWAQVPGDLRHTIEFYSAALIPYIYPQITAVEGPVAGMEHPQLVFIGRVDDPDVMRYLVIHEAGHEWFPMMVQQDEAAYAWMDEGLNTYYDELAQHAAVPDSQFHGGSLRGYLEIAGTRTESPLSTHIDRVESEAWGVAGYSKPALLTRALRSIVGDETFERTMRTYTRDWLLKHPTPWDFFNAFEREHGQDLDWFWHPWWFTTRTLDQAVAAVEPMAGGVRVTVEDRGRIAVPTRLLLTLQGGATVRAEIPVARWLDGGTRSVAIEVPAAAPVVRVEIDPEEFFPDVRPENDVWPAAAAP